MTTEVQAGLKLLRGMTEGNKLVSMAKQVDTGGINNTPSYEIRNWLSPIGISYFQLQFMV